MRDRLRDVALALLLFVSLCVFYSRFAFIVDDAWIGLRFANNLLNGHYGFNQHTVGDGMTSPLWLLVLTLGKSLGLSSSTVLWLPGALCLTISFSLLSHGESVRKQVVILGLMLSSMPLIIWSGAGLETGFALFLVSLSLRYSTWSLISLMLMPWVRPEMVPLMFFLTLRASWRQAIFGAAGSIATIALFRYFSFGHVLPLAALAKPAHLDTGFRYVAFGLLLSGLLWALVLLIFFERSAIAQIKSPFIDSARYWMAALIIAMLSIGVAGGDWMPGFRLFVPVIALVIWIVAIRSRSASRLATTLVFIGGVALWLANWSSISSAHQRRETFGVWLEEHLQEDDVVAALDIGYLGLIHTGDVIDLGGLTDVEIASLPGGHLKKHIRFSILEARNATHVLLHSRSPYQATRLTGYEVERRLWRTTSFQREFVVTSTFAYAPDYHYVLFTRRQKYSASATDEF